MADPEAEHEAARVGDLQLGEAAAASDGLCSQMLWMLVPTTIRSVARISGAACRAALLPPSHRAP